MKKLIALMLTATLLVASFTGCVINGKNNDTQTTALPATQAPSASVAEPAHTASPEAVIPEQTETSPAATAAPAKTSPEEDLAIRFVGALVRKDYSAALEMLASSVYPNALVFEEDIQWALPRTDFRVLGHIDAESAQYSTILDHGGNVIVTVRDGTGEEESLTVRTEIPKDGDGTPKVNGSGDFYRARYGFRTPSNVQVEINGVAVDKTYITRKNTGSISMYCDWCVPVIGIADKTIHLSCDCFDAFISFTPKAWSDPQNDGDCRHLPSNEEEEVLLAVKNLWNNMYAVVMTPDSKASDLYPYIAADADPDTAQIIFDAYKGLDADDQNVRMTQAVFRTDGKTFWANDHCLVVNLGYELTWDFYGAKDMKRLSHIVLAREGENWKIYRVTDSGLFSSMNYLTSEW